MKITVVIPSTEWRSTAGVRIRYDRLAPALAAAGHDLGLTVIDDLTQPDAEFDADIYLFSKTYDARAPVLARMIRAKGRRIGMDVFDDYFSQSKDSRFVHLRRWFRLMTGFLDFVLCATPNMADRLARLTPGVPCHVVNDPSGSFDAAAVGATVTRNAQRALATGVLDVGWFGIGDNPYFSLGLCDLHAFCDAISACRRHGFDARIRVLTNPRSKTLDGMEMLARLPLPVTVEDWTEDREADLIAQSLLCFLPVNAQSFSVVKSLNRGVTALTGGAQVLSAGSPLYDMLDAFVYRDIGDLLADLQNGSLRLRSGTVDRLADLLARTGDPATEASALIDFMNRIPGPARAYWSPETRVVAVIHGLASPGKVHKAIQRLRGLSVATPQCRLHLNFDVSQTVAADRGGLDVMLSDRAVRRLRPALAALAKPAGTRNGKLVFGLQLSRDMVPGLDIVAVPQAAPGRMVEIADYARGITQTRALLGVLFDRPEIYLSEASSPFWGPPGLEPAAAGQGG